MSKVILQGYIIVPQEEIELIKQALITHKNLTYQEEGCLVFNVEQCPHNLCRFNVYEEFVNKEAFEFHQLRVKHSDWGKASRNVERHYEQKTG